MFATFGGALFWLYVGSQQRASLPQTLKRTIRGLQLAAPAAALSGVAWLAASIANMTGDITDAFGPTTLHAFFFETAFGPIAIARLIMLALLVSAAVAPVLAQIRFILLTFVGGVLLITQAWLGHAAEGGESLDGAFMVAAYAAHVLAGAAWVGGLLPLTLAVLEHKSTGAPEKTFRLLSRYSAVAIFAVCTIVLSGIVNTMFRVGGNFVLLSTTPYGEVLFVKLGFVLAMLFVAAFNRFVLMPRLVRGEPSQRFNALGRSLTAEAVLGLAVLAAAAVLGITPPPQ